MTNSYPQFTLQDVFNVLTFEDLSNVNPRPQAPNPKGLACEYGKGGSESEPSCLVGTIVFRLDPEAFKLAATSGDRWGTPVLKPNSFSSPSIPTFVYRAFTQEANDFLARAQSHADLFKTWGEALTEAGA